jgi:hypothetical protein
VATLCRRAGYLRMYLDEATFDAMKLFLRTAQHVQFVPVSAAVDLKDDAGEQVYGDHAVDQSGSEARAGHMERSLLGGRVFSGRLQCHAWAAMSGKDWSSARQRTDHPGGPQRRAPGLVRAV